MLTSIAHINKTLPKIAAGLALLAIFTIAAEAAGNKKPVAKKPLQLQRATPILDTTPIPGARRGQVYKLGQPLTGGISMDVPRTPDAVARYLARMRHIIQTYPRLAMVAFSSNAQGSTTEVKTNMIQMIREIRAIVPPAEMKREHNDLAASFYYFEQLAENPGDLRGSGMEGFGRIYPMLGRLSASLSQYHNGVRRVITAYKLDPNLDPFGGEDRATTQRMHGQVDSMLGNLPIGPSAGGPCDDCTDQLQQLLGGMGGLGALGGGGDTGSLGNLDLGSLTGQMGNIDMSQLNKLMGELGGGSAGSQHDSSGSDSTNNLNQLLEQLQGQ
ncbi:MAG: hypothetical protein K2Y22_15700 [Candidatus Obscuribacterales bacterium]|nr:hypothetical protein [Candidatus Obscuribacterales bacterium]